MQKSLVVVLGAALVSSIAAGDGPPPCGYDVEYYVPPDCGIFEINSYALGVNEAGVVVGYIDGCPDNSATKAFIWWPDGSVLVIDVPWSYDEWAIDVNNSDEVALVVNSPAPGIGKIPGVWQNGVVTAFDLPAWANFADVVAIDDLGTLGGEYGNIVTDPYPLAALWIDGKLSDLSGAFPQPRQDTKGFNCAGQMAGTMLGGPVPPSGDPRRAFRYQDGQVESLGVAPNSVNSIAEGLSESGHVAGYGWSTIINVRAGLTSHPWNGFVWLDGTWTVLPPLPIAGYDESAPKAVNSHGVVVGTSDGPAVPRLPAVWFDAIPYNLKSLVTPPSGSSVSTPEAISDSGVIAGRGVHQDGARAVRLTPRPTPAADLTRDCRVDSSDLAALLGAWGDPKGTARGADINGDGVVDGADLGQMLEQWTVDA